MARPAAQVAYCQPGMLSLVSSSSTIWCGVCGCGGYSCILICYTLAHTDIKQDDQGATSG